MVPNRISKSRGTMTSRDTATHPPLHLCRNDPPHNLADDRGGG